MQRPLILASASPRRQAFLHALGLDFTVMVADIDETPAPVRRP
ncbi:MAG: Maf family protein [Caldilineaceae bacterium]